tara:strand:- start:2711 stop:3055 length:345 start_codon:yes stop_codon:yes gene_type:complete
MIFMVVPYPIERGKANGLRSSRGDLVALATPLGAVGEVDSFQDSTAEGVVSLGDAALHLVGQVGHRLVGARTTGLRLRLSFQYTTPLLAQITAMAISPRTIQMSTVESSFRFFN